MSKHTIEVVYKGYCGCHPETCSCNDYCIVFDGEKIASGNSKPDLERLVLLARLGAVYAQMEGQ